MPRRLAVLLALALAAIPQRARADQPPIQPPSEATLLHGEILVDIRDDVPAAAISSLAQDIGITLEPNSPLSEAGDKIEIARVDPAREADAIVRLNADPRVEFAEVESLLWASFVPNDPLYASKQWHLQRVGAEAAWDYACGRGVTVAVLDTGIACYDKGPFSRGSDLSGTRCGGGYNFVHKSADAFDDHGHGTHVAGTIAQTTNNGKGVAGLAYCAELMPVKVLSSRGFGTTANVAEGIRFAVDHGAQVINMSLGGGFPSPVLRSAVNYAIDRGVVIVAAAGNSGRSVAYPAAFKGVIAVSATDSNDTIAWFSSRGSEIAIAAPGVGVTQQTVCDGGKNHCELFGTFSGTSMASPHVAGSVALLMSEGVSQPEAIRKALAHGAVRKNDAELYGAGLLNAGSSCAYVHWMHMLVRIAALAGCYAWLAYRIRKRRRVSFGRATSELFTKRTLLASLTSSTGLLFFLPLFHMHAGCISPVELCMRPFGEWDLLVSASLHKWLPLANALPVFFLASLVFSSKRLRPLLGGFSLGMAALLAQLAISGDLQAPFGAFALALWCAVNAAACLWVARQAIEP